MAIPYSSVKKRDMDNKQLQSYKQHNELLSQFIVRLSAFYEGFSDDLDKELQVLRGHLSGKPNFTLATVSINKLNRSLQHQELTVKKYSADTVSVLESSVKSLQQDLASDPELTKEAAQQLVTLNQPVDNLFRVYPLFQKALILHRKALKLSPTKSETSKAVPQSDSNQTEQEKQPLYKSIFEELNLLIESYAKRKPNDLQLVKVREKLSSGVSEDALLKSCVVVLRMIVQDAMSEASITGKVIQSLHNALGNINNDIQLSIDDTQSQYEQRKSGHTELYSHIENIEAVVNDSDSLEDLKAQAQSAISELTDTLHSQEESDKAGQEVLMATFNAMQSQIVKLQKQTLQYKKKLAEQLMLSQTDPLTRLPNRQAYNEKLAKSFVHWQKSGGDLSVAILDIDHFKSINDKFGHAAGDKTLQVMGKHLKQQLQDNEFIARWGGEEFILLLHNVASDQLKARLETLRMSLAALPFKFKKEKVTITASIGATSFIADDQSDDAFERADTYLYHAKRHGRNQVITDEDFPQ